MSRPGDIITGYNLPADLEAALKKYGMPENCTGFSIQCRPPNFVLELTFSRYLERPSDALQIKAGKFVEETRTFKLVETNR